MQNLVNAANCGNPVPDSAFTEVVPRHWKVTDVKTFAISCAALILLAASGLTQARADVGIDFNLAFPFYGNHDGGYYYGLPDRRRSARYSCAQARRLVRNAGYRRVRATDCRGRIYGFAASRDGRRYSLRSNARRGTIVSVKRL